MKRSSKHNYLRFAQVTFFVLCALFIKGNLHSQSCCVTGTGTNYNLLNGIDRHVLGVRYTHKSYMNIATSLNPDKNGEISYQEVSTVELLGQFRLNKRFRLSVFLPYTFINQFSKVERRRNNGLGDMTFFAQYIPIDLSDFCSKNTKHQLQLGAGVKLPSGNYVIDKDNPFTTMLPGTGSVDFTFNIHYILQYKKYGLNIQNAYKINTANSQQVNLGNNAQLSLNGFYTFSTKNVSILPQLGLRYDHQFKGEKEKRLLNYTGGDFVSLQTGLTIYYKKLAVSAIATPAVLNRLNWTGETRNRYAVELGLYYIFSSIK